MMAGVVVPAMVVAGVSTAHIEAVLTAATRRRSLRFREARFSSGRPLLSRGE